MKYFDFKYSIDLEIERELDMMFGQLEEMNDHKIRLGYIRSRGLVNQYLPPDDVLVRAKVECEYMLLTNHGRPVGIIIGHGYTATDIKPERAANLDHIMIFYLMTFMANNGIRSIINRSNELGRPLVVKVRNPKKL